MIDNEVELRTDEVLFVWDETCSRIEGIMLMEEDFALDIRYEYEVIIVKKGEKDAR